MSIVRPASASRWVIPMSAAVLAVGESGTVWIPNNEPSDGTNRPVGRTGIGAGGAAAPTRDDASARAATAPVSHRRRAGEHTRDNDMVDSTLPRPQRPLI